MTFLKYLLPILGILKQVKNQNMYLKRQLRNLMQLS